MARARLIVLLCDDSAGDANTQPCTFARPMAADRARRPQAMPSCAGAFRGAMDFLQTKRLAQFDPAELADLPRPGRSHPPDLPGPPTGIAGGAGTQKLVQRGVQCTGRRRRKEANDIVLAIAQRAGRA